MNDNPQSVRGDVDGTATGVVDGEHHEFDVPADASRAVMNDGIVTVESEDTE